MEDCIFCKIIKGEVPSYKVYEDERFFAFLDIKPRNPGHTLVIPKEHFRWVWDVPYLGDYFEAVGRVANAIRKGLKTDWVVSLILGEEVPHAHIWLIPRFSDDGHGDSIVLSNIKDISPEEMKKIAKKIKQNL